MKATGPLKKRLEAKGKWHPEVAANWSWIHDVREQWRLDAIRGA